MAKFSKSGWSSDFNSRNFTGDQLERYLDRERESMSGMYVQSRSANIHWKVSLVCPSCGKKRLSFDFVFCPMCGRNLPQ